MDYAILNNHTEIAEFLAGHNAVSGKTILVTAVTIIQQFWRKRRSKIPQKTKLPDLSTNNIIKQIENMHFNKLSKESLHPKESREHNVMDNQL